MLINKKKRLKYLGFDDTWFTVIGILILSFAVVFVFNRPFSRLSFVEVLTTWGIALFFSICDWFTTGQS